MEVGWGWGDYFFRKEPPTSVAEMESISTVCKSITTGIWRWNMDMDMDMEVVVLLRKGKGKGDGFFNFSLEVVGIYMYEWMDGRYTCIGLDG